VSKQRRLGKGIDALLQGRDISQLEGGELNSIVSVPIDRLVPNPDQPRKAFSEDALHELARSIEERGIIQPILAEQQDDGRYIIIAGERRYRAARIAGLTVVPVLPGVFSEDEKLEIALIENVQRQDLTAIEEARAYRELMHRLGLNQDDLAKRLGRSRPAVANSLRLLRLPENVQELVVQGALSGGHARTLLGIQDADTLERTARLTLDRDLSVRALERIVPSINAGTDPQTAVAGDQHETKHAPGERAPRRTSEPTKTVEMQQIEDTLVERLGTRVLVTGSNDRGKIEISYLSMEDLDRIVDLITARDSQSDSLL
jgi:ParB family chromosome partitioning protein